VIGDRWEISYLASCDKCGIKFSTVYNTAAGDGDLSEKNPSSDFCSPFCEQADIDGDPPPSILYGYISGSQCGVDHGDHLNFKVTAYYDDHAFWKILLLINEYNADMENPMDDEDSIREQGTLIKIGGLPMTVNDGLFTIVKCDEEGKLDN
jgi:hypothetical protein